VADSLSWYLYNTLPIEKKVLETIEHTPKTVATTIRLEIEESIVKKILEGYQADKWCAKLRMNLKSHEEVQEDLETKLLFIKDCLVILR